MIGYHYTSLDNWNRIQKEGLLPYPMNKPELKALFPSGTTGVWLWTSNPTGKSHAGNILYQVSRRGTHKIVKLRVSYDPKKILQSPDGANLHFRHFGDIEAWKYHTGEAGVILTDRILPQEIRLIKEYNLVERLI